MEGILELCPSLDSWSLSGLGYGHDHEDDGRGYESHDENVNYENDDYESDDCCYETESDDYDDGYSDGRDDD